MALLTPENSILPPAVISEIDTLAVNPIPEQAPTDTDWALQYSAQDKLEGLSGTIHLGSLNLTREPSSRRQEIVQAREEFFTALGFHDNPQLHNALAKFQKHSPALVPIRTFMNTQHTLQSHGLNGRKIITDFPGSIGIGHIKIATDIDMLQKCGLDYRHIISVCPNVISQKSQTLEDHVASLRMLGVDAAKVIHRSPRILTYDPAHIQEVVDEIIACELNPAKVLTGASRIVGHRVGYVTEKFAFMQSLGLDAKKVGNYSPPTLNLSQEDILEKMAFYKSLGFDAAAMINKAPGVLTYKEATITSKLRLLRGLGQILGLEAAQSADIINGHPNMLAMDPAKLITLAKLAVRCKPEPVTLNGLRAATIVNLETVLIAADTYGLDHPMSFMVAKSAEFKELSRTERAQTITRSELLNITALPVVKSWKRSTYGKQANITQ